MTATLITGIGTEEMEPLLLSNYLPMYVPEAALKWLQGGNITRSGPISVNLNVNPADAEKIGHPLPQAHISTHQG